MLVPDRGLDVLSEEQEATIHETAMRICEEIGLDVLHDDARRLLSEAGLSAGEAIAAPSSSDPSAAGYCPLCSTEYRSGFTTCAECRFPIEPLAGR